MHCQEGPLIKYYNRGQTKECMSPPPPGAAADDPVQAGEHQQQCMQALGRTCQVANADGAGGVHVVVVDLQLQVVHGIVPEAGVVGHHEVGKLEQRVRQRDVLVEVGVLLQNPSAVSPKTLSCACSGLRELPRGCVRVWPCMCDHSASCGEERPCAWPVPAWPEQARAGRTSLGRRRVPLRKRPMDFSV